MVAKDNNNDSALHHAAANLNYLATKVLSEAGAPLEEKNKEVCWYERGGRVSNWSKSQYTLAMKIVFKRCVYMSCCQGYKRVIEVIQSLPVL